MPFRLPSAPVVVAPAGNLCDLLSTTPPPDISLLDKDFLSYDPASRTLAVSYTRFFLTGIHSGLGQIEVARAHIPATPTALSAASFGTPITVWPEEQFCPAGTPSSERTQCGADNQGACPAVAPGGDIYVAFGWLRIAPATGRLARRSSSDVREDTQLMIILPAAWRISWASCSHPDA